MVQVKRPGLHAMGHNSSDGGDLEPLVGGRGQPNYHRHTKSPVEHSRDRRDPRAKQWWRSATHWLTLKRYVLAVALFSGLALVYVLRVILSVAILPIADEYGWDDPARGFALSAFFIGYIVLQVPGGWLCTKIGGKAVFGFGVLIPALITAVTPFLAPWYPAFVAARVLTGLGESATYPAVHALLGHWAPSHERSRMVGLIWSGAYMGTTIAFPMAGAIVHSPAWYGGWRAVFYFSGGLGVLWSGMWYLVAYSTPDQHPSVSPEEAQYIKDNILKQTPRPVPWRFLFSSREVWAIIIANFTHNWGGYTLLTWLPSYLKDQLHFNLQSAGFITVMPYLCCFACSNLVGLALDARIQAGMRVPTARKWSQVIAEGLPALALVGVGFVSSTPLAVCFICVAVGAAGAAASGYGSRALDIAPELAGLLMGITNAAGTIPGIVAPYLTGVILGKHPSRYHWQIVFYLSAAVTAGGLLVWLVWVRLVGRLSLPDVDDDGPRARTPPAYGASDPEAPPA